MKNDSFRLIKAEFDTGGKQPIKVDFIEDAEATPGGTHITLLMGANGTNKSRLLSSCVNAFRRFDDVANERNHSKLYRYESVEAGMNCISATMSRRGRESEFIPANLDRGLSPLLPSRVLVISNLIKDRFTFADHDTAEDPFYYYLGVRQRGNMMTTVAMDRLASEAVLRMLSHDNRYQAFSKWAGHVLPECELALVFPKARTASAENFLLDPKKWSQRITRVSNSPSYKERFWREIELNIPAIADFLRLLDQETSTDIDVNQRSYRYQDTRVVKLDDLTRAARKSFGDLRTIVSMATSLELIGKPSLLIRTSGWMAFDQLSSGEQNLLATGARLIAYAQPASFVVIDEPEVSLNVAWQQRYITLISEALEFAPGSHVLIASHSPYLVAELEKGKSTVVLITRRGEKLDFQTRAGEFWGWGSEAILYNVLGVHSASNYQFTLELANVLKLVKSRSKNSKPIRTFLAKCDDLDFGKGSEPLRVVIKEIRDYAEQLGK
jgi:predicted ATPase